MSRWTDRIEQSQFSIELKQCLSSFKEAEGLTETLPELSLRISRVGRVLARVQVALNASDPELVSPSALQSYVPTLQSLRQELLNFVSSANVAAVDSAESYADLLLMVICNLPAPSSAFGADEVHRSTSAVTTAAEKLLATFQQKSKKLEQSIFALEERSSELSADTAAQKGVLSSAITAIQQQFQQEQDSRSKLFLASEESRADEFRKLDASRRELYTKAFDEQRDSLRELTDVARTEHSTLAEGLATDGQKMIAQLDDFRGQAERLLGIVGTTTIISGYKREADAASMSANRWNIASVAGILGFTGGTVYSLLPLVRGDVRPTWETLIGRVVLSLALGVFGTYAARQAKYGEETARRNRRFELELSSIGPFIAELGDDTRKELKVALVNRLFGQPEPVDSPKSKDVSTTSIVEVVKAVLQNLPSVK